MGRRINIYRYANQHCTTSKTQSNRPEKRAGNSVTGPTVTAVQSAYINSTPLLALCAINSRLSVESSAERRVS